MNFYAVFKFFNKQFIVKENEFIYLNNLNYVYNSIIEFNKILMISKNDIIKLGNPYLKDFKILALVIKNIKTKKLNVIKFKRRKNYIRNYNSRQILTKLKILNII